MTAMFHRTMSLFYSALYLGAKFHFQPIYSSSTWLCNPMEVTYHFPSARHSNVGYPEALLHYIFQEKVFELFPASSSRDMCCTQDIFYNLCGHWGQRQIKIPCPILKGIGILSVVRCFDTVTLAPKLKDSTCPACRYRAKVDDDLMLDAIEDASILMDSLENSVTSHPDQCPRPLLRSSGFNLSQKLEGSLPPAVEEKLRYRLYRKRLPYPEYYLPSPWPLSRVVIRNKSI